MSTVALSKALSRLLRHEAVKEGIPISQDGWVPLEHALNYLNSRRGLRCDEATVHAIVETNEKQRFSLREGREGALEIRANQGHSIAQLVVDMTELTLDTAPRFAVHGTYHRAWPLIREGGLSRMKRQHIHLGKGPPGEPGVKSTLRPSCELLLWIDVHRAINRGIRFLESSNGVILTEGLGGILPPEFFDSVVERSTGSHLPLSSAPAG